MAELKLAEATVDSSVALGGGENTGLGENGGPNTSEASLIDMAERGGLGGRGGVEQPPLLRRLGGVPRLCAVLGRGGSVGGGPSVEGLGGSAGAAGPEMSMVACRANKLARAEPLVWPPG